MEYEKMIELLREVNDSNLIEFELEDRDFRLKMKKESKSNENVVKAIENTSLENPADEQKAPKKGDRKTERACDRFSDGRNLSCI